MLGNKRIFTALCASTIFTSAFFISAGLANAAPVQTIGSANTAITSGANLDAKYAVFAPKAQTSFAKMDYAIWDEALRNVVLRLGASIRKREGRPDPIVGTRRITGHRTAYRLEGSRVTFSYMNDEYIQGLTEYRQDLERIANEFDVTSLSRNEQLAFWFNLHNVAVIEQIALNYPVRQPSNLRVGVSKELLHDAKLLNIRGVDLSLRDIREHIVYPNWDNKDVIYGFFHGNIGSPALQNYAFTSKNVHSILKLQASDFVNSLRGFHESRRALKISTLYEETRPFYFLNWETDLKQHLTQHAGPEVLEELETNKPFEFDRYDMVVADLQAGERPMTTNLNAHIGGQPNTASMSPGVARLFRELDRKTEIMKSRGMLNRSGTVTIEDLETIDVDIPPTTPSPKTSDEDK